MKKLSNEDMSTLSGGSCTLQEYLAWIDNPPWWVWIIPGGGGFGLWAAIVRQDKCGGQIIVILDGGGGSDRLPGIL